MGSNVEIGLLIAVATLAVSILMLLSRISGRRAAELSIARREAEEDGAQKEKIKFLEQQMQSHLETSSALAKDFGDVKTLASATATNVSHLEGLVGRLVKSVDEQNETFRDLVNSVLREGLILTPRVSIKQKEGC